MESADVFTLAYVVFSFCFVFTPNEFQSAGLTVQNLFSERLGSEDVAFVQYHVRRATATLLVHSALPLGYYLGMCVVASNSNQLSEHLSSKGWQVYVVVSSSILLSSCLLSLSWCQRQWASHPIPKALAAHAPAQSSWRAVASSINTEFRRIDKFATGVPGARVIVTDTWIIKVTTYYIHVAQQHNSHLTVVSSKQHNMNSSTPVQIVTLRVDSIDSRVQSFNIRLNSTEYSELREKLQAPVRNAANVVVHLTMSELFLEIFRDHVELNQMYERPTTQELEPCVGCMQENANIKLVCQCQTEAASEGGCQQCFCRPMWCLTCMGKWFASRQDQQQPETWLGSRVPCPTCRAKFCILDVCLTR
ncbi:E3 ubiquitin-protein ligase TM129 [Denticeps clupeoides]|uniref:E3 ubiquitin-protein ligase TM129 n=1 Tax=Denticeps clupeoides TaxID=299321 RepID=A0AAY4D2L6_9TELE|nr:E3 ubiquitin-protein ligase TM129 [Denticeps clupeoides]